MLSGRLRFVKRRFSRSGKEDQAVGREGLLAPAVGQDPALPSPDQPRLPLPRHLPHRFQTEHPAPGLQAKAALDPPDRRADLEAVAGTDVLGTRRAPRQPDARLAPEADQAPQQSAHGASPPATAAALSSAGFLSRARRSSTASATASASKRR